ncbi:hypothetical protein AB7M22_003168 [Pseudomonas sp. ADAK2 TE3594]
MDINSVNLSPFDLGNQTITEVIRSIDLGPSAEVPLNPEKYPNVPPLPKWVPAPKNPPKFTLPPNLKIPEYPKPTRPTFPDDFEDILKAKLLKYNSLKQKPVKSKINYELWLAATFRSLGEARTASADWLSLTTAITAYNVQLNEIAIRISQVKNEEISRLLLEEKDILQTQDQIKTQKNRIKEKIDNLESIYKARQENDTKLRLAARLRNEIQIKRDPLPDGKISFVESPASADYEKFSEGTDNKLVSVALVAAKIEDELPAEWSLKLFEDEVFAAKVQLIAIEKAEQALIERSNDIASLRESTNDRLKLLSDQHYTIASFLTNSTSNLSERQADVAARYISAIRDLRERAWSLIQSINITLDKALPKEISRSLLIALQGDEADRGEKLVEVEGVLVGIQEWMHGLSQRMTRESMITSVLGAAEGTTWQGNCSFKNELPKLPTALLRGIRIFSPNENNYSPCIVRITPKNSDTIILGFSTLRAPEKGDDNFFGAPLLWNDNPFREWKVILEAVPGSQLLIPESIVLEILFDRLQDYDWLDL